MAVDTALEEIDEPGHEYDKVGANPRREKKPFLCRTGGGIENLLFVAALAEETEAAQQQGGRE